MACQMDQIKRKKELVVIPVSDPYGNFGVDAIPGGEYLIRFHEGKIIAHQLSILTASSKLHLAVAEVKADTTKIIEVATANQLLLKQIVETGSPAVERVALDKVLTFYESEFGFDDDDSDSLDMRLIRLLQSVWSKVNKRSRSMKLAKKLIRIIWWLAHPHKDDPENPDTSKINLLTVFTNRCCVLAIRILILLLIKLCGSDFEFIVSALLLFWHVSI